MLGFNTSSRGRPNRVDLLPEDLREQLHSLLRNKQITQKEILEIVNPALVEQGEAPLSAAGLNRYSTKMVSAGGRLREAREVAEQWVKNLGAEPEGDVGKLTVEFVRTLAFDMSLKATNDEIPLSPKDLQLLSNSVINLEKALTESERRQEIVRKRALQDAVASVEKSAKKSGLSADTVADIKREILGV